jgi:hypothetical protein
MFASPSANSARLALRDKSPSPFYFALSPPACLSTPAPSLVHFTNSGIRRFQHIFLSAPAPQCLRSVRNAWPASAACRSAGFQKGRARETSYGVFKHHVRPGLARYWNQSNPIGAFRKCLGTCQTFLWHCATLSFRFVVHLVRGVRSILNACRPGCASEFTYVVIEGFLVSNSRPTACFHDLAKESKIGSQSAEP